jgi:hypothetical protein
MPVRQTRGRVPPPLIAVLQSYSPRWQVRSGKGELIARGPGKAQVTVIGRDSNLRSRRETSGLPSEKTKLGRLIFASSVP